jgi:hypothetical protein
MIPKRVGKVIVELLLRFCNQLLPFQPPFPKELNTYCVFVIRSVIQVSSKNNLF